MSTVQTQKKTGLLTVPSRIINWKMGIAASIGKKLFGSAVEKQLQQRRIANMVLKQASFLGKGAAEDLPNDKWFVQNAIKEYKTNPRFKNSADSVIRPVKYGLGLVGMVGLLAGLTLIGGPVGIAAALGACTIAIVGGFTITPGLASEFNAANKLFKQKALPPFLAKTSMKVVKYSSKEKASDLADGVKDKAGDVREKLTGYFSKKFRRDKTPETKAAQDTAKQPENKGKAKPKPKAPPPSK